MNLSNNEIICLIIALYYYEQEYESQENDDIVTEVVDLRDKLEDYLLRTQTPEYAKASADFMKTLAQMMEEKKMHKRIEEMLSCMK